ncbi:MAG: hypothetical protein ACE3JT_01300, partial [Acinetobacter radioresistens]
MSEVRNDDPNFDVMGNFDHGLTLALSKGRILKETLPLLETAGINLLEDPEKSRKLIFPTTHKQVRDALEMAAGRIRAFHQAQKQDGWSY